MKNNDLTNEIRNHQFIDIEEEEAMSTDNYVNIEYAYAMGRRLKLLEMAYAEVGWDFDGWEAYLDSAPYTIATWLAFRMDDARRCMSKERSRLFGHLEYDVETEMCNAFGANIVANHGRMIQKECLTEEEKEAMRKGFNDPMEV